MTFVEEAMMKRFIAPLIMMSLGLNLLLGYQNCAEVDPGFAFNEMGNSLGKLVGADKKTSFVEASDLKVVYSNLIRYKRSVRYKMQAEFRVKYTNDHIGIEPKLTDENLYLMGVEKNLTYAKLDPKNIQILEKECVESVNAEATSYFDCKYTLSTKQKLSLKPALFKYKHKKYKMGRRDGSLGVDFVNNKEVVSSKEYVVMTNYINKYPSNTKKRWVKKKTKLPKIAKRKKVIKKAKKKVRLARKLPAKVKKKQIEEKVVEGIYCHIRVLNPPHLELPFLPISRGT